MILTSVNNLVSERILCEEFDINHNLFITLNHKKEEKIKRLVKNCLKDYHVINVSEKRIFSLSSNKTMRIIMDTTAISYSAKRSKKNYSAEFIKNNYQNICDEVLSEFLDCDLLCIIDYYNNTSFLYDCDYIHYSVIDNIKDLKFSKDTEYWSKGYNSLTFNNKVLFSFDNGLYKIHLKNILEI